jgi:hypothetical protein
MLAPPRVSREITSVTGTAASPTGNVSKMILMEQSCDCEFGKAELLSVVNSWSRHGNRENELGEGGPWPLSQKTRYT